MPKMQY